ncbi:MAG: DNA mismatch repair endonuclease MutL [Clostridia bacterium]|nr:DNA mismatch repair endonuclease MutL [Clostridia bacterium]
MAQIKVLDRQVAELIAAGEVVERPASVIKELVENSIDAGATQITVEIQNGGITFMRVTDNGSGIAREDIKTAFLRHATSKVDKVDDLDSIATLGFRGEALASVAAVARVELLTCKKGETGSKYSISGGEEEFIEDAGCPIGTTIIVRDLFFNTPARMKFLKKDVSESNAVAGVIDKIALSHPEISFRFIRDGKNTLTTPGDNDLKATVYAVFGREFANSLIKVDYTFNNMSVSGFVGSPLSARANRNMQHFYINGRYIKSKNLMAALEQACKNSVMVGKFPSCVLNLSIPYNLVDINVSPSKTEARFADERAVFNIVYYAVKSALTEGDNRPEIITQRIMPNAIQGEQISLHKTETTTKQSSVIDNPLNNFEPEKTNQSPLYSSVYATDSDFVGSTINLAPKSSETNAEPFVLKSESVVKYTASIGRKNIDVFCDDEPEEKVVSSQTIQSESDYSIQSESEEVDQFAEPTAPQISATETVTDDDDTDLPEIRIIGEAFTTYILAEYGDSVVFIDKHAAHERILFEKIKQSEHDSQMLLEPIAVPLAKEEYAAILDNLDLIIRTGFDVEDFGASSVIVRAVPTVLVGEDIKNLVYEMAGGFTDNKNSVEIEKLDWLYHNIACRAAIKAGSRSNPTEMAALAERIIRYDDIKYCPHGRPVAFILTKKELEKQFGRLQ